MCLKLKFMSYNQKKIVKIAKALADENRYKIFKTIAAKKEIVCKEITEMFPLSQPTISHHLKVLMESGLIESRKEGQWSNFSVNHSVLKKYLDSVNQLLVE